MSFICCLCVFELCTAIDLYAACCYEESWGITVHNDRLKRICSIWGTYKQFSNISSIKNVNEYIFSCLKRSINCPWISPQILSGASSSRRTGCCRNSSRDLRQSPRISHSSSLTDWADSIKCFLIFSLLKHEINQMLLSMSTWAFKINFLITIDSSRYNSIKWHLTWLKFPSCEEPRNDVINIDFRHFELLFVGQGFVVDVTSGVVVVAVDAAPPTWPVHCLPWAGLGVDQVDVNSSLSSSVQ